MIRPTLLTIWPRAYDFPIWRELVDQNKDKFNDIYVVTTHNSVKNDYRDFVLKHHPYLKLIDTPFPPITHWYDEAVNLGLDQIKSGWILFLEQDFWFKPTFLDELFKKVEEQNLDFACLEQESRLHLGCFLVKRDLIDKTHRYFGEIRNRVDCFDVFTMELQILTKNNYKTLTELGFINHLDYKHLNGLTHNLYLLSIGQPPVYKPNEFREYLQKCLQVNVPLHDDFIKLVNNYIL